MFAQVAYLMILYFGDWTRGDEGLVHPQQARAHRRSAAMRLDLTDPTTRYMAALVLFAVVLLDHAGRRALAASAACWWRSARTRSARACSATTPSPTSSRPWSISGTICGRGRRRLCPAVRLCRLDASPRSSIRSCRCCGCCSAAPPPCSGRFVGTLLMYYVVDVDQRLHRGLHADRRRRADPARAVLSRRASSAPIRERWLRVAAVTPLLDHAGPQPQLRRAEGRRRCRLRGDAGRDPRHHRPERRRQDHLRQPDLRPHRADRRHDRLRRQDITDLPAHQRVRRGIAYTFQITSVFANLTAYDNVALPVQRTLTDGRGARRGACRRDGGAGARRARRPRRHASPARCPTATSGCSKWRWGWR